MVSQMETGKEEAALEMKKRRTVRDPFEFDQLARHGVKLNPPASKRVRSRWPTDNGCFADENIHAGGSARGTMRGRYPGISRECGGEMRWRLGSRCAKLRADEDPVRPKRERGSSDLALTALGNHEDSLP